MPHVTHASEALGLSPVALLITDLSASVKFVGPAATFEASLQTDSGTLSERRHRQFHRRNIDLHNRHWLLIYARLLSICRDVGHRQPHPSAPPI